MGRLVTHFFLCLLWCSRKYVKAYRFDQIRKTYENHAIKQKVDSRRVPRWPTIEDCVDYEKKLKEDLDLCNPEIKIEARKQIASMMVINGTEFKRGNYLTLKFYDNPLKWANSTECEDYFLKILEEIGFKHFELQSKLNDRYSGKKWENSPHVFRAKSKLKKNMFDKVASH